LKVFSEFILAWNRQRAGRTIAADIVSIIIALTVGCQSDLGYNISVITKELAENLGPAVGKTSYAVIKASNVMIGVD
jgi:molybdopterin-binding protein